MWRYILNKKKYFLLLFSIIFWRYWKCNDHHDHVTCRLVTLPRKSVLIFIHRLHISFGIIMIMVFLLFFNVVLIIYFSGSYYFEQSCSRRVDIAPDPPKIKQQVSQWFSILLDMVNDQKKSIKIWLIKVQKCKMAAILDFQTFMGQILTNALLINHYIQ